MLDSSGQKRSDTMFQNNLNQIGYTSCIKICGVPILPPLITEDKRKEINDYKQRAIEVEKKLKGKRSSIDSGVMTGSYIDHLKNNEPQQNDELCLNQLPDHGLIYKGEEENGLSIPTFDAESYIVSDSYLKTALEDPAFREFFSATAEKMFKDNTIDNILNLPDVGSTNSFETKDLTSEESEIPSLDMLTESLVFMKPPESIDLSFSDGLSRVPSVVESDITVKISETNGNESNGSFVAKSEEINKERTDGQEDEKELISSPPPRIRRNSYTLDSPSSVLLEHMAKEIASSQKEADKWQMPCDKKEKPQGPGFKTFSYKSQRKHWNKNICNPSSTIKVEKQPTNYTFRRSNTFVKPRSKMIDSNYSLPSSTRTSPLQNCPFTRSVDCIKSMGLNPWKQLNKRRTVDLSMNPEAVNTSNCSQIINDHPASHAAVSDSGTFTVQKDSEFKSVSVETSPKSLTDNPSSSGQSICSTEHCSPPQIEFSDSVSQISIETQSTSLQQTSVCARSNNLSNDVNRLEDFDDIASLCSSMSISRFLPSRDVSRPSTAGDTSEANIRLLKMKHENELRELLEKQRKEEEKYSQVMSSSGSVSSRTTTNLSIGEPFEANSEVMFVNSRESCSRELFPSQKTSPVGLFMNQHDVSTEREKLAASKITAYAKGYLTRRLLKTEKVQQLIELIRESLTCAFSLQLEPHLKPNDLELHARLALQLNTALCELQSIVSAPVATRMAVIAVDRERLRRPASRPSSTISLATRKSILRRQQSMGSSEKKQHESRARTKSFTISGNSGSVSSGSRLRSDSASTVSAGNSRLPWR